MKQLDSILTESTAYNNTNPKAGVSCSKDGFVVKAPPFGYLHTITNQIITT